MNRKIIAAAAATAIIGFGATACSDDSDAKVVSKNLSKAADQFEVERRIVFFNGITDTYLMTIEGRCSIGGGALNGELSVVCKVGEDTYKKHFLGLSDNVSYFVEQMEPVEADRFHYRVIFKPEAIIPNFDRP